jgi:hypothetical protein
LIVDVDAVIVAALGNDVVAVTGRRSGGAKRAHKEVHGVRLRYRPRHA